MPNHTKNLVRFGHRHRPFLAEIQNALKGMTKPDPDTQFFRRFRQKEQKAFEPEEIKFDFNRLIPMPDDAYYTESSSTAEHGYAIVTNDTTYLQNMLSYAWVKSTSVDELLVELETMFPEIRALGQRVADNINNYGVRDGLEWARKNWGTKWNAYSIHDWTDGEMILWDADECSPEGTRPTLYWTQIQFETAWCMPVPIIERLAALAKNHGATFDHWFSDEDGGSSYDPTTNTRVTQWTHNVSSEIYWE
jgi:hypothetical protein